MSTVKAANLQNTGSGAPTFKNSSGTEIGQLCKAWVNLNGTGTVAIRDDFNVSSITDNGTGNYTINFTTAMANANYAFAGTAGHVSPSGSTTAIFTVELPDGANISSIMTTSLLQVEVNYVTASADRSVTDREFVSVIVFGA